LKGVFLQELSAYPTKNQGFSLIEILVSLVVMSIGLMGLSGLQIAAIKAANESHFRNEASLLLMDTANRMRSNNTGMNDYLKSISKTEIKLACASEGIPDCEGTNSTCSATDLAQFDLNKVACKAGKKLPSGEIELTKIANNVTECSVDVGITNPYYSLTIAWVETAKKNISSDQNNKSIDLNCFSLRN